VGDIDVAVYRVDCGVGEFVAPKKRERAGALALAGETKVAVATAYEPGYNSDRRGKRHTLVG